MTLYTLVNILKSVALSQPNVRMATDGSIYDKLNATNSVKYDVVHFSQTKHIEDEETDTYGFNIFYVSRLEDSLEDNRLQIQSIGKEVLGNILRSFCENWSIDFPEIIYYPFTQKFADLCAGVYCRVEIEVPKEIVCADDYIEEVAPSKGIKLENIKVEIDENGTREVTPSPGFDGIGKVTIVTNVTGGSCNLEYKEVEYTENGDYTILPSSGYDGLSEVAVSVDVPSRYDEGYDDGYEDGEAAQKAKLTVTSFTTNDTTYVNANGWSSVTVNVDTGIGYHTVVFDFSESVRPEGLINKAAITITSTYGSTSYTYSGNNITTLLLPGVDYIITYSEVKGYQHPNSIVLTTVWDGSSVIDVIYSDISYLTVSPSSVTFYENVSAKTITVSSLVGNWTATTNDNWYGLSEYTGGTGDTTITITANTQNTARTGTVTFTDGTNTAELIVKENYFIGKPLTFNITSSGTIYWVSYSNYETGAKKTIQYKINGGDWTTITSNDWPSAPSISVNSGDIVLLRGDNVKYSVAGPQGYYNHFISSDAMFEVEGNIMSLIDSTNFATATTLTEYFNFYGLFINCTGLTSAENLVLPATTLASWCYSAMFYGCTNLATTPVLPATTLTEECYFGMFASCTSLTTAPELPATTLAERCYQEMFSGCTSLTTAPELPATTMPYGCYAGMFQSCSGLTTAPALPATTLADKCYYNMFQGCTRLTTAPSTLPATTLTDYCYYSMFAGCTSLTTAPALPATTLANYCYQYMFQGCTSLTSVPSILPATALTNYCYSDMFAGCTSLTTAPELSATTLAYYCCGSMFSGCTSLTTAPALPATTLAQSCYSNMFNGCTSLTSAPELPAITLTGYCYERMFQGCTNLNYIKCLAINVPNTFRGTTYLWVDGVAATGTFVKNPNMSSWPRGEDGIPANWTIIDNS